MPNADQLVDQNYPKVSDFAKHLNRSSAPESSDDIAMLRKEIAELREAMRPSIILTGQRAVDAYWELTKNHSM